MEENKLYNLEQLEAIASGNDEFVIKMVNMFLDMTPHLVTRIGVGIQGEDWVEVHSAVHKMKPSVDMMGVKSLHDVVRKIEYNAKNETDLDHIPALYEKLSETLAEVYRQLRDR